MKKLSYIPKYETPLFETSEQFHNMRNAWKHFESTNNPDIMDTAPGGIRYWGLTLMDYIFYAALRQKDLGSGFTLKKTEPSFVSLTKALSYIRLYQKSPYWRSKAVYRFGVPYGDSVSHEVLLRALDSIETDTSKWSTIDV